MNAVHGSQMMCLGTQMGNKLQWIISIFTLSVSIQWPFRGRHFLHFSASKTRLVMAVFQFFYPGGNKRLEKKFGVPWPQLSHPWRNVLSWQRQGTFDGQSSIYFDFFFSFGQAYSIHGFLSLRLVYPHYRNPWKTPCKIHEYPNPIESESMNPLDFPLIFQ